MTSSSISPLAFVLVLAHAAHAAAQAPPTAQFPVDPGPAGSGSAVAPAAPAPAPTPAPVAPAPPAQAAPSVTPAPAAPPVASQPAPSPAPAPPAAAPVAPAGPAGPGALQGVPPPQDAGQLPPPPGAPEIHFEGSPGWAIGLDARAGIGILTRSEARGAFAFAGGLLRGHYQYYEIGFFYDHADDAGSGGTFANFGGFAGAWLPFHNWVDFEAAVGLGSRRYTDRDPRYGAHGYAASSAALSLIFGVSDRAHSDSIGGRVGGQLVITDDLTQHDKPWSVLVSDETGAQTLTHGTTHVGGLSLALVFTLGLDAGAAP